MRWAASCRLSLEATLRTLAITDALTQVDGAVALDRAGKAVGAADVDGDGSPDLLVGADEANAIAGALYLVPGGAY